MRKRARSIEQWEQRYQPLAGSTEGDKDVGTFLDEDGKEVGYDRFETYGHDYKMVCAAKPDHVWTVVEAEGSLYLVPGWHYVNRLFYFITRYPADFDEKDIRWA